MKAIVIILCLVLIVSACSSIYFIFILPRKRLAQKQRKEKFIEASSDKEYAKFEDDIIEPIPENNFEDLPIELFTFTQQDEKIFDKKFETKAVGYWGDAIKRFCKSTSSVVCFFLLAVIVFLSIFGELIGGRDANEQNTRLRNLTPKVPLLCNLGILDGTTKKDIQLNSIVYLNDQEKADFKYAKQMAELDLTWYKGQSYDLDRVTKQEQFDSRFIKKLTDIKLIEKYEQVRDENNAVVFETDEYGNLLKDANGQSIPKLIAKYYYTAKIVYDSYSFLMCSYEKPTATDIETFGYLQTYYHSFDQEITKEMLDAYLDKESLQVGVVSYERAAEINQHIADDLGIELDEVAVRIVSVLRTNTSTSLAIIVDPVMAKEITPHTYFVFGTDNLGIDMWSRIWNGLGLSMLIGLVVGIFCIVFGICWGSISGYYGGLVDLAMERFTDILVNVPSMIVLTLLQFYMENKLLVFILALTMTSWVGIASRTRIQFYRYKNREYVLASRTMGARDGRLIFKHILPNGIGPLVNSAVAIIPASMRFETSMTYLGIASLSKNSIGQIISSASEYLTTSPYLLVIPSLIFSVIMVSFSVLGLGLRDALNPALRGS